MTCHYGYIPSGPYAVPLPESGTVTCERPVAVVVGGYNRPHFGDDTFLASTEIYSIVRSEECDGHLPDLPVERRGMFGGGWSGIVWVAE